MPPLITKTYWRRVHDNLAEGRRVLLALVARHSAHSPGTTGARLAVPEGLLPYGTVGGGVMEAGVLELADRAFEAEEWRPRMQQLVHRKDRLERSSGLICAGEQTNVYYLCTPGRDQDQVSRAADACQQDRPAELTITPDGLSVQAADLGDDPVQIRLENDSETWGYTEQLLNLRRAAILGGGHCGLALSRVLDDLGYHVQVFDTRKDLQTLRSNSFADAKTVVPDYADAGALIPFPRQTVVVVMTPEYLADVRALVGLAGRPFKFIGAMGSRAKIGAVRKELRKSGAGEEALSDVTVPVGLPIGSNTPAEIAISVAAQLIRIENVSDDGTDRSAA